MLLGGSKHSLWRFARVKIDEAAPSAASFHCIGKEHCAVAAGKDPQCGDVEPPFNSARAPVQYLVVLAAEQQHSAS